MAIFRGTGGSGDSTTDTTVNTVTQKAAEAAASATAAASSATQAANSAASINANIVNDTTPQLGGELDGQTNKITNIGDPTSAQDAATKTYVDSQVQAKDALSELSGDSDDITEGSTNLFLTTTERTKLSGIEASATADQTAEEIRTLVESASDSNVFTDADHSKLNAIEANATADQTDAEIKTAYENNSDTNAFTDAEKTKLSGIETGATADQTASEILTAIKTVDGSGSGLDADLLDGNEASAFATSAQGSTADSALQNVSEDTTPQLGGNLDTNSKAILFGDGATFGSQNHLFFGTDGGLDIYHYNTGSIEGSIIGNTQGTLTISQSVDDQDIDVFCDNGSGGVTQYLKADGSEGELILYHYGSQKLATKSSGVDITGNITVSGTVDGRDLATDGTKLDGVASSATANPNAIDNVVEDTTPQLGGVLDTNGNNIEFGDSTGAEVERLKFGAGDDLQIYHDGSHSYISDQGTGNVKVLSSTFQIMNAAENKNGLVARQNAEVELYHNGSEKLATTSSGVDITGILQTSSDVIIGGDLTVSGTTTTVNTETINLADNNIVLNSNHTGTPTQSAGITIERGSSTDKVFQWNETNDYWETDDNFNVTGNITVSGTVDGRDIATDGTKLDGIEASADVTDATNVAAAGALMTSGGTITGDVDITSSNLSFDDSTGTGNNRIRMGTGNDLAIFHNGSNAKITNNTGALQLTNNTDNSDVTISADDGSGGNANYFRADGSTGDAILYHYGTEKIKTQSDGVDVTGNITVSGTVDGRDVAADGATADAALPKAGGTMTGDLVLGDNVKAKFGASNDLNIVHNGSASSINNNTGTLQINQFSNDSDVVINSDNGSGSTANYFRADGSTGDAILYHYGTEKLKTQSGGVDVTGTVTADGLTVDGTVTVNNSLGGITLSDTDGTNQQSFVRANSGTLGLTSQNNTSHGSIGFFAYNGTDTLTRARIQSSGDFVVYADDGTSEDFYWDASASRLGLGTTSPEARLEVAYSTSAPSLEESDAGFLLSADNTLRTMFGADPSAPYAQWIQVTNSSGSASFPLALNPGGGNVGIGTTALSSYNSTADDLIIKNASSGGITVVSATNGFGNLFFADGTTGDEQYRGYVQYRHDLDSLRIGTAGLERIKIDSSGNVGIGTDSPAANLHVSNASGSELRIDTVGGTNADSVLNFRENSVDRAKLYWDGADNDLYLETTVGDIALMPTGNVGIGTTSPDSLFHISSGGPKITITDTTHNTDATITVNDAGSLLFSADANNERFNSRIEFGIDGSEVARFDSNGRLGIGTTSPSQALDVAGSINQEISGTNVTAFKINADLGTTENRPLEIKTPGADNASSPFIINTNNSLAFQIDGTERLHITDAGDTEVTGNVSVTGGTLDFNSVTGRVITITADSGLDSADASIYLGNATNNFGFDIEYEGSGSGNTNAFVITSTNQGNPKEVLRANQDGIAKFPNGAEVTGNITVTGTVDGRDVAADGATADAALPKAGGTMTGNLSIESAAPVLTLKDTTDNDDQRINFVDSAGATNYQIATGNSAGGSFHDAFSIINNTSNKIEIVDGSTKVVSIDGNGIDVTGDIKISGTDIFHQLEGDATNGAGFKNREIVSRGVYSTGTGSGASRYTNAQSTQVIKAGNPNGYFFQNVTFAANALFALPISIPGVDESTATNIGSLIFRVGSQGISANTTIGMGLYTLNKYGMPSQLVSQGTAAITTSTTASSAIEITPSVTAITPGRYALCIANLGASTSHLVHNYVSAAGSTMFVDGFYNAGSGIAASVGLFWNAHTGTTMPTSLATVTSAFASALRAPHMDISLGTAYTGE